MGSGVTLLILVTATGRGQFADIAGYTAGLSIGALVAAVAGSGTSLAYVTGDEVARSSVRWVRYRIVAPLMVGVTLASAIIYSLLSDLSLLPVLFGGGAVLLNNLAELESASLERTLGTPKLLLATLISRLGGIVVLLFGLVSFSSAMMLVAAINYVLLLIFARKLAPQLPPAPTMRACLKLAYTPSLMSVSVLSILIGRAVLIAAPVLLSVNEAGILSALISAQQNLTGVLISALYTMMAARASSGREHAWMRTVATRVILVAAGVSVLGVICAPLVLRVLHVSHYPSGWWVWTVLALAVLPYTDNRRLQYKVLGSGLRSRAVVLLFVIAIATLVALVGAAWVGTTVAFASVSLISEVVGSLLFRVVYRGRRVSSGGDEPEVGRGEQSDREEPPEPDASISR